MGNHDQSLSLKPSQHLICMVGLPRSGKSTLTRLLCRELEGAVTCVSPDAIRLAMHGQPFIPKMEGRVWQNVDLMTEHAFETGHQVVIADNPGLTLARRQEWRDRAPVGCTVHYVLVPTLPVLCKQRAYVTAKPDLVAIIDHMAAKAEPFSSEELETVIVYDPSKKFDGLEAIQGAMTGIETYATQAAKQWGDFH